VSRTVFLGTSDFAATVLRRLTDSPHRPQLVITPPDRPRGRGRHLHPPPAAEAARELELPLFQAESINSNETVERVRSASPKAAVVCAFGQLIREPLLSELLMLNVHPSLLPRWRGAAPIERAILAGDAVTGVSVMRVSEGLDSGPVAVQEQTPIEPNENYGSLSSRLADIGGELVVRALELEEQGALELREQDDAEATYAEKIDPAERRLDPGRPAEELARKVHALTPHIGAYLETEEGERLGVRAAAATDGSAEPGRLEEREGALWLGCAEGVLRLDVVQPPAGRPMPVDAFVRGHRVPDRND
jgi:methionyl-tRNA formyltransferase